MDKEKYSPVPFDPKTEIERELSDPEFRRAWESIQDEFSALDALLSARRAAGLTQEQVAALMGVSQPNLARIESALGSRKHSPSLETLRKYARACGKRLEIRIV